jgi:AraC-like DNA-binding protein
MRADEMNRSPIPEGSDVLVLQRSALTASPERDIEAFWNKVFGPTEPETRNRLELGATADRAGSRRGIRQFLTEAEGTGHWDFFKLSDYLHVSVTTARYRQNTWFEITGNNYFKVRVLLSGRLLGANRETLIEGPHAVMFLSPGEGRDGYFIAKDVEIRLLVLHCRPGLLTDTLGLAPSALPPPFNRFIVPTMQGCLHSLALGPEVLSAAQRVIDARHEMPTPLRVPFLEAMAMRMLCEILGDLSNSDRVRRTASQFSARDLNRIYEARDYLSQHFASPPVIPQLARMVGINQTKLKAGFKAALGMTIADYTMRRRMERASELLITQDYPIEAVANTVGYRHAANFTCAFKRHFGCLPRIWKQRPRARP